MGIKHTTRIAGTDISKSAIYAENHEIEGSTIVTADIADNAVTTNKILDGAVTSAKIAEGTIVKADLAEGITEIPCGFLVYKSGSTYYARNGSTGVIAYSGADASVAVNTAFSGGNKKVFIKSGVYTGNFTPAANTIIEGEGINNTILRSTTGTILDLYDLGGHITVRNIDIDGVSRDNAGVKGLRLGYTGTTQSGQFRFDTVRIRNCETGISMDGAHDESLWTNSQVYSCKRGVDYKGLTNVFVRCWIGLCSEYGIKMVSDNSYIVLDACTLTTNLTDFIVPTGIGAWIKSYGTWFEESINGIFDASTIGAPYFTAIGGRLHSANATYLFDLVNANAQTRIHIDGVDLAGVDRNIRLPTLGFVTYYVKTIGGVISPKHENSGTSTGTGAEQTIAHGLAGDLIPNNVTVIPTVTGATVSGVWADATNIYCTVTVNKAYKWSASLI